MKTNKIIIAVLYIGICITAPACKKDFLDAKPNTNIVVPSSLSDFQAMIDYSSNNRTSSLGLLSCDDYFIQSESILSGLTPTQRNSYLWNKDLYGGEIKRNDWIFPFKSIFYANSVLSGLKDFKTTDKNQAQHNSIKGQALFIRAFNNFDLVINFSKPYDPNTSTTDLGIPLKLSPNVDEIVPRSNLNDTYKQIIADLTMAIALLESSVPSVYRNRSSKPAAYAFGARLFLSMRNYVSAEKYADSCLALYDKLLDYKTINKASNSPFADNNDEVILSTLIAPVDYNIIWNNSPINMSVDSNLYNSYKENDLRKSLYFISNPSTGLVKKKRGYANNTFAFAGLATDEVYLIKAECLVRRNQIDQAMVILNKLLRTRWDENATIPSMPYQNITAITATEGLAKILTERRKELIWRGGLRWDDIRRLNKEGSNITLTRIVGGRKIEIEPNSPRYVFPIPDDEISLSGINQNLR